MTSFTPWVTSVIDAETVTRTGTRSSLVQLLDCAKLLDVICNRGAPGQAKGAAVAESETVGED